MKIGDKVKVSVKESIVVTASQHLDNRFTKEEFIDVDFYFREGMVLVGRVGDFLDSEDVVIVELEQPMLIVEFDLDYFTVDVV